jgi:hypothetical protein
MQKTNNYIPTIVERGARRATRRVCGGERSMRYYKKAAHRSYRRIINQHLYDIKAGYIDPEEYDDSRGHCRCTSREIW